LRGVPGWGEKKYHERGKPASDLRLEGGIQRGIQTSGENILRREKKRERIEKGAEEKHLQGMGGVAKRRERGKLITMKWTGPFRRRGCKRGTGGGWIVALKTVKWKKGGWKLSPEAGVGKDFYGGGRRNAYYRKLLQGNKDRFEEQKRKRRIYIKRAGKTKEGRTKI